MRNFIAHAALIFVYLFIMVRATFAQAPAKMTYQAVIRDQGQNAIANRDIGARISILGGSADGPVVYREEHTARTNANGLVSLRIGMGAQTDGSIEGIEWLKGPHLIRCEVDPQGGVNYSVIMTTELLSVPYALFAAKGDVTGPQGPAGPVGPEGMQGARGQNGVGIDEVTDDGTGIIAFRFDDGTTYSTPVLTGPQGPTGSHDLSPYVRTQDLGALVSGAEGDVAFAESASSDITSTQIANWNAAYGWGDHQDAGYLETEAQGLTEVLERSGNAQGQPMENVSRIGIGRAGGAGAETSEATAILQAASTSQGFLIPRMTGTERDLIADPAEGLMIYNTAQKIFQFFDGSNWQDIKSHR